MAYARKGMGAYIGSVPCASGVGPGAKAAGMGCSCGCSQGLAGWLDGTGLLGTGLFAGGLDFSTWGPGELAVLVVAGYVLFSTVFTTSQAVSYGRGLPARSRKRKAAALRKRAAELTGKK